MILRDSTTGAFEVYDISNNRIDQRRRHGASRVGMAGRRVRRFQPRAGETDMLMRNSNTGVFETLRHRQQPDHVAAPMGQVGLEWSVAGFGDFSTQRERDRHADAQQQYRRVRALRHPQQSDHLAAPMGQVGLEWSVAGFGDFSGNANETDMLMRNSNTGVFEIYDISNNRSPRRHRWVRSG